MVALCDADGGNEDKLANMAVLRGCVDQRMHTLVVHPFRLAIRELCPHGADDVVRALSCFERRGVISNISHEETQIGMRLKEFPHLAPVSHKGANRLAALQQLSRDVHSDAGCCPNNHESVWHNSPFG